MEEKYLSRLINTLAVSFNLIAFILSQKRLFWMTIYKYKHISNKSTYKW